MFRYRLRTLLILLAVGPPLLALAWFVWSHQEATPTGLLPQVGGIQQLIDEPTRADSD
jgi:hypothetical protein